MQKLTIQQKNAPLQINNKVTLANNKPIQNNKNSLKKIEEPLNKNQYINKGQSIKIGIKKEENQVPKQEVQKVGFTNKPSDKLQIKTGDVFGDTKKNLKQDSFQYVYNLGGIPCKIDHGSIKNKLKWNQNVDINQIGFDPLLITCFEGLIETKHPYSFIANQACIDLLNSQNANEKIMPILQRLVWPLRNALKIKDEKTYINNLQVFKLLVEIVNESINPHLKNLLNPLSSMLSKPNLKNNILEVLNTIQEKGGEEAFKQIRTQVPGFFK